MTTEARIDRMRHAMTAITDIDLATRPTLLDAEADVREDGSWAVVLINPETDAVWAVMHPDDFLKMRNEGPLPAMTLAELAESLGLTRVTIDPSPGEGSPTKSDAG